MDRYYKNSLPDVVSGEILDSAGNLAPALRREVKEIFQRLMAILEANLAAHISKDASIYTGTSGFAYLYLTLHEYDKNKELLQKAHQLAETSLKRLRKRDVTFLCGDLGPLCVSAVIRHHMGQHDASQECVSAIMDFLPDVVNPGSDLPNELLYGRVGYLFGLLFIKSRIPNVVDSMHLKQVAEAVIDAGKSSQRPHLMWNWHGKEYLGGAHGVAGILYILLQVKEMLDEESLRLIRNTVAYLLSIRFEGGNLPSSVGSASDRLVHWCHGAPGFVQLLLTASEVWKDKKYLDAAELCGELVWQRGLLRKGYGICHGVAGNAYTFIALFQATGDPRHLQRALEFARWCSTYDKKQDGPPDRPLSLFEGLAGTIYFLHDVQNPLKALFPAYSVAPFSLVKN